MTLQDQCCSINTSILRLLNSDLSVGRIYFSQISPCEKQNYNQNFFHNILEYTKKSKYCLGSIRYCQGRLKNVEFY